MLVINKAVSFIMVDLDKSISVAIKSGETQLGINSAIRAAKMATAKLIVIAANTPEQEKEDLKYYADLSGIPIVEYPKSSQELGIICGRAHLTSAVSIMTPGDSDILDLIE